MKVEKASVGSRAREREKGGKEEEETGDVQQQAIKNEEVEDRSSRGEGGMAAKDGDRKELKPGAPCSLSAPLCFLLLPPPSLLFTLTSFPAAALPVIPGFEHIGEMSLTCCFITG